MADRIAVDPGQILDLLARHHAAGDLGNRRADRLGDEGHRAAGARIDFDQIDDAVLHSELDVHQAAHRQGVGQHFGLALDFRDDLVRQAVGRQRTGAVAGMDARFLDMLQHAGHEHIVAIAQRIDIDLDRVAQILVDQHRRVARYLDRRGDMFLQLRLTVDNLHRPATQHIAGPHQDGITDAIGDCDRFLTAARDAVGRLAQLQLVDQRGETLAIFGQVDGIGTGAQDRDARILQRLRQLERRLPAKLHQHARQRPVRHFDGENFQHVFGRQRLEIEAVGRVIVGRHGFRVAVHHDRFIADLAQREAGMDAAIVELDPLPDPVRPAAQDYDLLAIGRRGFILRLAEQRRFIGRIHVGRLRLELGGAGVDALEDGAHAQLVAQLAHFILRHAAGHRLDRFVDQARPACDPALHAAQIGRL
eukprot:Opistho-1_new@47646